MVGIGSVACVALLRYHTLPSECEGARARVLCAFHCLSLPVCAMCALRCGLLAFGLARCSRWPALLAQWVAGSVRFCLSGWLGRFVGFWAAADVLPLNAPPPCADRIGVDFIGGLSPAVVNAGSRFRAGLWPSAPRRLATSFYSLLLLRWRFKSYHVGRLCYSRLRCCASLIG